MTRQNVVSQCEPSFIGSLERIKDGGSVHFLREFVSSNMSNMNDKDMKMFLDSACESCGLNAHVFVRGNYCVINKENKND